MKNKILKSYSKAYGESYYSHRKGNDLKRQKSFKQEEQLIKKYISSGTLIDVGCSTGEFVKSLDWDGKTYGMEVSDYAIEKAKENNILFNKDIWSNELFDIIIYRGTIQHIDVPFLYLQKSYDALKPGGKLVILATPNANSIYYKLWNTLPALDVVDTTFYIPSDKWLVNALENIGFNTLEIQYPYLNSPYSNLLRDHFYFLLRLLRFPVKFPFWKNMMNIVVEKPNE